MDAIVVDTEKTGKDCIQYLREQVCKQLHVQLVFYFSLLLQNIFLYHTICNSNIEIDIIFATTTGTSGILQTF